MKRCKFHLALTALVSLSLTSATLAADRPDFSGEWNLNIGKSAFGDRKPTPIGAVLKIDHKDPVLTVIRTIATESGVLTTKTVYSTDGKEMSNPVQGGREMKNTTRWDDTALVIETPVSLSDSNFTIRWKWILSEDGKTLSTARTFAPGEQPQTEVYEKR